MKKLLPLSIFFYAILFGCASEKSDFSKAEKENSIEAYETFLKRHPQGEYTELAERRLDTLAFRFAREKDSLDLYKEFNSGADARLYKSSLERESRVPEITTAKIITTKAEPR